MQSTNVWDEPVKAIEGIAGDRRADRRNEIKLDLRWKLIRRRRLLESGTGASVDLSSGGILFDAGRALPVGLNVELSIAWPAMLNNSAPLQLIVAGRVVRSSGTLAGIQTVQHEFRTVAQPAAPRPGALHHAPTAFVPGTGSGEGYRRSTFA